MPDEPMPARLPSLTSLRFLLALGVVLCHMASMSAIFHGSTQRALIVTEPIATSAVSGFFVLSGFVLTWAHTPGDPARAFWRRRFWKIVPNHVLGWTMALAFFAVAAAAPPLTMPVEHSAGAEVADLFLVQNWVPHASWFFSLNTPSWSLSCEAFFYALFPALLALALRIPARLLGRVWTSLALTVIALPLISTTISGHMLYDWLPINERSMWFIYILPPVRLPEFLLGIVTARLLRTGGWPRLSWRVRYAPLVLAFALLPVLPSQFALGSAMAVPLAPVIAGLARSDAEGRTRRMARPALVSLGEASYALYITHWTVLLTVRQLLGVHRTFSLWAGLPIVLALIAGATALARLVYRHYETPLMRRFARRRVPSAGYATGQPRVGGPEDAAPESV